MNLTCNQTAIPLLAATPILGNRYFLTLAAGSMAKEEFVHSQLQFSYAVGFFSRHLAALIALSRACSFSA
jgi:hypothetical protein